MFNFLLIMVLASAVNTSIFAAQSFVCKTDFITNEIVCITVDDDVFKDMKQIMKQFEEHQTFNSSHIVSGDR
ncbi:MAG: hypothetical protein M3O68_03290 [Thermoproteota archaeon]|jgi:dTDP-glucose pyrophosphorylase|nr:hypothetical protein [Thermoproteota archaeon]